MADARTVGPLRAAGTALGMGMGGFIDGILLHQIFQVHNMLSARIPPDTLVRAKTNMVWDGMFHLLVWVLTFIGIVMLWNAVTRRDTILSGRALAGSMLMGWGIFNLVEGIIDHHILGLHHVIERLGLSMWDWAFLASGVILIVIGWLMTKVRDVPAVR